jgi:hypothetical protein
MRHKIAQNLLFTTKHNFIPDADNLHVTMWRKHHRAVWLKFFFFFFFYQLNLNFIKTLKRVTYVKRKILKNKNASTFY